MSPEVEKAYETLRLPTGASPDEVKKAYRNLTMAFHPDRFDSAERKAWATEQQKEINAAYKILSRFQRTQSQAPPSQPPRQPPPPAPPQSSASRSEGPQNSDPSGTVQPGRGRKTGAGLAAVVYWFIGAGVVLMILAVIVAVVSWPKEQPTPSARGAAAVSKPLEPLQLGLRRYTTSPFRLNLVDVDISLVHVNVAPDGLEVAFRVRAGGRDTALIYQPPGSKSDVRKNSFGQTIDEDFEELHIVDDTGGSFYSTTGFVGGRQGGVFYYRFRQIHLHFGEAVVLSAKFPMIDQYASSISFESPGRAGSQPPWWWRKIPLR